MNKLAKKIALITATSLVASAVMAVEYKTPGVYIEETSLNTSLVAVKATEVK